ncbi:MULTISPECIES: RsmB/NOP family class I SAM-dependent RNA methyltransferase [unclassified Micromonospora]|uniref:RsmB/NOP family class I SAM-dependent RNA methyltransferase n=1 Tax=Micromonospora TaxID=1873 RepID=UPI00098D23D0|nr:MULTISPECIES: transcription antitermination factor NusB [unclassified Micromonospora]MDI5941582.1 transcription antitermination factor NusB [Micromonospora sp. DH15]OON28299.1 methyltransferase [Micromonospora sp. Rc5]
MTGPTERRYDEQRAPRTDRRPDRSTGGPRGDRPAFGDRPARGGRGDDRRGARPARPAVDLPRHVAYQAVAAVHRDDAYANLVLPALLRQERLTGRDAAFATELTYGTLRHIGTLDAILTDAAGRDVARIDPPVRDALRLGAYQLLHTRVPAHAAVSSTVDLVRAVGIGATGFANAVLREVAGRDADAWVAKLAPAFETDPIGHLALAYSHPQWIVRSFAEALGGDLGETTRLLLEDNERPPVHLCARPGLADPVVLADEVGGAPGAFSPYAVYLAGGAPGDLPALAEGRAHVQDEGSQLVANALAVAPLDGPDAHWLDLCAGPGGKSGLLGAIAAQRGARLTAVEVSEHRARLVGQATRGLPVTVLHTDGRTVGADPELPEGHFDRVLVDAPCTGLGALRRRPEARWRKQPSDLPPLTRLQRELLSAALRAARPGGLVAYVTCSPHTVETHVTVTEAARRAGVPADFVDARPLLPAGMPGLGDGPSVQLWPHRHGTDAMFLAVLRRG